MDIQQSALSDALLQAKAFTCALQSSAARLQRSKSGFPVSQQRRSLIAGILTALQQLHKLITSMLLGVTDSTVHAAEICSAHHRACSVCSCNHGASGPCKQQLQVALTAFQMGLSDWQRSLPEALLDILATRNTSGWPYTCKLLYFWSLTVTAKGSMRMRAATWPNS